MRVILVAVLTLAAVLSTAPLAAAPTQDELAGAALTAADAGGGFIAVQSGPVDQLSSVGVPNYLAVFARPLGFGGLSFEIAGTVLVDAAAADANGVGPEQVVEVVKQFGIIVEGAEAPTVGSDTIRYTVSGSILGQTMSGDIIIWRHAGVIAGVLALGDYGPTSLDYAIT